MGTDGGTEFQKFDAVMKKVLAVSKEELLKREKAWQRKRAKKKRAKS
jgi:U3 small nucleolar ribonucleoprotein component